MDTRPQTGVFLLAIDYDIPLTNPTISQDIRNLLGIWGGLFTGKMRQIGYPNLKVRNYSKIMELTTTVLHFHSTWGTILWIGLLGMEPLSR